MEIRTVVVDGVTRSWSVARRVAHERDRGVCAICGLNCEDVSEAVALVKMHARHAPKLIMQAWLATADEWLPPRDLWQVPAMQVLTRYGFQVIDLQRRTFFDIDHIIPVAEGGGECDLDNLRTLCIPCHRYVTAGFNRNRVRKGRRSKATRKQKIPSRPLRGRGFSKAKRKLRS